jgi:hypothetical protein
LLVLLLNEYYLGENIKEDAMDGACSMFGGEYKYVYTEFWWWGSINGRENLEDLGVNGS